MLDRRLKAVRDTLRYATQACREDMHEPDEQGISASVGGDHLDNAMSVENPCGEIVVRLAKDDGAESTWRFNLADLIALARKAE